MFLRSGLEYNAGRALGMLAMVVLAPYVLVLVQETAGSAFLGPALEPLQNLAPAAAVVASLSGMISLALLGKAYGDWELRPPLALIGACCVAALVGLVGTRFARPAFLPGPWPWVAGGAVLLVIGMLFARLVRLSRANRR